MAPTEDDFSGLIPLEDDLGDSVSLPDDMVLPRAAADPVAPVVPDPAAPVVPATPVVAPVAPVAPVAQVEGEEPDGLEALDAAVEAEAQGDPAKAGLLADLRRTRGLLKDVRKQNVAGVAIAKKLLARPDLVHLLETGQPIPAAVERELRRDPAPVASDAPVVQVDTPQDIADLELIANTNQLFKQDGSGALDLDMARKVREISRREAARIVDARMAPVERRLVEADANVAMGEALSAADQLGIPREIAGTALAKLAQADPQLLRDPSVVATALFTAAGIDAVQRRRGAPPVPAAPVAPAAPVELVNPGGVAPVIQERSTVQSAPVTEVSGALRSVMESHGLTAGGVEKTLTRLSNHKPGTNYVLEE